jgi:hypothetical protein
LQQNGLLPAFPFGSDFTEVEQCLLPALRWLQTCGHTWLGRLRLLGAACRPGTVAAGEADALLRMGLDAPRTVVEWVQRRLLQAALRRAARRSLG